MATLQAHRETAKRAPAPASDLAEQFERVVHSVESLIFGNEDDHAAVVVFAMLEVPDLAQTRVAHDELERRLAASLRARREGRSKTDGRRPSLVRATLHERAAAAAEQFVLDALRLAEASDARTSEITRALREKRRQEDAAAPVFKILKRGTYLKRALGNAHMLAMLSKEPAAWDAFEVCKIALAVLAGEHRKLELPIDYLERLRQWLKSDGPERNEEADFRRLVALVETRRQWIDGPDGFGHRGADEEAKGLRRNLHGAFGKAFATLTAEQCAEALRGLLRPHGKGRRTAKGVAGDLIIACGAWGYSKGDRDGLTKKIDRACARGRSAKVARPKRSRGG